MKRYATGQDNELQNLAGVIVGAMQDKKAHDIVTLDLRSLMNRSTDLYIIAHAESDRQVQAIAQSVEEGVWETLREHPWHTEGYENREWILLDYVTLVVHIFLRDKREFYGLEELWGDAQVVHHHEGSTKVLPNTLNGR